MRRVLVALVTVGLGTALLAGVACGGGGGDEEADIEAAIRSAVEAYNSGNGDDFLARITDNFLAPFTKDEFREAVAAGEFAPGEPPLELSNITDVEVSGDSATAVTDIQEGRALTTQRLTLVRQADAWLLDGEEVLRVPAPEGATEVDMGLVEFAFNLAELTFPAGDVAFQAHNDGQQEHELGIVKLPEGVTLQEALEAEDLEAVGAEEVAFFEPIEPGAEASWIVEDLEPGRYGYACFIPDADDPEGTPHAFKGMVGEFTVE